MGANGAVKSLDESSSGVYRQDEGKIILEGKEIHMKNLSICACSRYHYGISRIKCSSSS